MGATSGIVISAASSLASAGMGVYKSVQGNKMMKEAQKKIDNYQRQTLTNTLEGVAVPQQMYNLETQKLERSVANAEDAAMQAGSRGLAALSQIQENEFEQQQQINANLENSLYQLSLAKAQEDARIQQMYERREEQELAGYGALFEAGRQEKFSGMGDVAKSFNALGSNIVGFYNNKNNGYGGEQQQPQPTPQYQSRPTQQQPQPQLGVTSLSQPLPPSQLNFNEKKWNYATGTWE